MQSKKEVCNLFDPPTGRELGRVSNYFKGKLENDVQSSSFGL